MEADDQGDAGNPEADRGQSIAEAVLGDAVLAYRIVHR